MWQRHAQSQTFITGKLTHPGITPPEPTNCVSSPHNLCLLSLCHDDVVAAQYPAAAFWLFLMPKGCC